MHIHRPHPAVVIRLIIVNACPGVCTAGISGNIIGSLLRHYGSADHGHTVQNVEELGDVRLFLFRSHGIPFQKYRTDKAGHR